MTKEEWRQIKKGGRDSNKTDFVTRWAALMPKRKVKEKNSEVDFSQKLIELRNFATLRQNFAVCT